MLLSDILHSLSSELSENHPERVVKQNSNFTEGSYKKKLSQVGKLAELEKKKKQNAFSLAKLQTFTKLLE